MVEEGEDKEEYELVPISPIRKLEKRLNNLEEGKSGGSKVDQDLLDIAKTNQEVVDDLVKTNAKLTNKMSEMTSQVEALVKKIDSFMDRIEVAGGEEGSESSEDRETKKRLKKLEKKLNAMVLSNTSKEKLQQMRKKRRG